ncbi:MAG: SIS domain-containing protein [Pseudomonadota bacterium]
MDYYNIIASRFQDTIESIAVSVDRLAESIALSSDLMVKALLSDNKIISCGNGPDSALAQLFTCMLIGRFEQDRPALPALALNSDGTALTAIAETAGYNEVYARQLRGFGQAGDVLLCISSTGQANNLLRAVQAAHERNMMVVALSNASDGELGTLLQPEDIEIRIDSLKQPKVVELQTMVLNCLCELIEKQLFGSYQDV